MPQTYNWIGMGWKSLNPLILRIRLKASVIKISPVLDIKKLSPVAATMSSVYKHYSAEKCIDGVTNGPKRDLCHSNRELAPWLALDYGKGAKVSMEKVVFFPRTDCCWKRTKNVQIRLSNKLPVSGSKMFQGGELLGTFKGPATRGQKVEIKSVSGWEKKFGRFLIIQMNNGDGRPNLKLNLKEAFALGISQFAGCVIEKETDYLGNDIEELQKLQIPYGVKNQQACAALTATKEGALFWTYRASDKKCWIKTSKKGKRAHKGLVSGNIECGKYLTNASVFQDLPKI